MAFTASKQFLTVVGDRLFGSYKLTGDGSDTTWSAPCAKIDGAWVQDYTSGTAGTTMAISWATNVITFEQTVVSSSVVHVFFIGV